MPKYTGESSPLEGNFTSEYYEEESLHDVIFLGDCEVYENFDPIYLWENFGITSYIRGNAQQQLWHSYYILEDTLRKETPKAVVFNVQELMYDKPQKEEYNRMTFDGMEWSLSKVKGIMASKFSNEELIEYVFPILRYHSRILELDKDDFEYFFKKRHITHNGYYMRVDVLPASKSQETDIDWLYESYGYGKNEKEEKTEEDIYDPWADIDTGDEEEQVIPYKNTKDQPFGDMPMKYLDKIRLLCEENDIDLILIKAPSLAPIWYDGYNEQVVEYAKKNNLQYINFYEKIEELGVDYEEDTYDGGLHMNYSGAKKLSKYMGEILSEEYGIEDKRKDETLSKIYGEKKEFHDKMIEDQNKELKEFGKIISY